jgi:hypothetical protein
MDDITASIVQIIPPMLVWGTGVILSVKMLRRGGGTPEKLFVAGCSLLFIETILSPLPRIYVDEWMSREGTSALSAAATMVVMSIPGLVLSLAGFTCLVIAFWKKFSVKKPEIS